MTGFVKKDQAGPYKYMHAKKKKKEREKEKKKCLITRGVPRSVWLLDLLEDTPLKMLGGWVDFYDYAVCFQQKKKSVTKMHSQSWETGAKFDCQKGQERRGNPIGAITWEGAQLRWRHNSALSLPSNEPCYGLAQWLGHKDQGFWAWHPSSPKILKNKGKNRRIRWGQNLIN